MHFGDCQKTYYAVWSVYDRTRPDIRYVSLLSTYKHIAKRLQNTKAADGKNKCRNRLDPSTGPRHRITPDRARKPSAMHGMVKYVL
jgi:hypothetical protein